MARTGQKSGKIETSRDVLKRHLHGASIAAGKVAKLKKSSGGGKKGRAKIKICKPPVGGWQF